jgi:hypothetical protein
VWGLLLQRPEGRCSLQGIAPLGEFALSEGTNFWGINYSNGQFRESKCIRWIDGRGTTGDWRLVSKWPERKFPQEEFIYMAHATEERTQNQQSDKFAQQPNPTPGQQAQGKQAQKHDGDYGQVKGNQNQNRGNAPGESGEVRSQTQMKAGQQSPPGHSTGGHSNR